MQNPPLGLIFQPESPQTHNRASYDHSIELRNSPPSEKRARGEEHYFKRVTDAYAFGTGGYESLGIAFAGVHWKSDRFPKVGGGGGCRGGECDFWIFWDFLGLGELFWGGFF
jgi:hypothetical protein